LFCTGFDTPAIFSTAGFIVGGGDGELSNGRFNSFDNCVIFWIKVPLKREIKCCQKKSDPSTYDMSMRGKRMVTLQCILKLDVLKKWILFILTKESLLCIFFNVIPG